MHRDDFALVTTSRHNERTTPSGIARAPTRRAQLQSATLHTALRNPCSPIQGPLPCDYCCALPLARSMSGAGASGAHKRSRHERDGGDDAAAPDAAGSAGAAPNGDASALDAVMALLHADFQCAICQGLVVAPHILPCSHRFCGACILQWIERSDTCPTCRADVQGAPTLERGVVRRRRLPATFRCPNAFCSSRRTS